MGVDHDDRDVVLAPGPVGLLHQPVARPLRVGFGLQDLSDPFLAEHPGQAVGADQDAVSQVHVQGELVDREVLFHAEGTGQDGPLRVAVGLVRRDLPFAHHPLDEGRVDLRRGCLSRLRRRRRVLSRVSPE